MLVEPEIIEIPAGVVTLGVPECPAEMKLPHHWKRREGQVPVFGIAKYPITVEECLRFAEETRYAIAGELRSDARLKNPRAPAAFISWIDATRYVQWLARKTAKPYRLVRDAEYEKASRGGLVGMVYPWGDEAPEGRADYGNPHGAPKPVGSFPPNGYGLHDMVGSIWCWCEECFEQVVTDDNARMSYDDTLIKDTRLNPICRGGSFKTADTTALWCAYRHEDPVDGRFDCIGFRAAISLEFQTKFSEQQSAANSYQLLKP